jgi:hypothetical protein
MNVWLLRKKLKGGSAVADTAETAQTPPSALGLNALLSLDDSELCETPAVQSPAKETSALGLDDLFEMNDCDIRSISPALTFSGLKKPKLS